MSVEPGGVDPAQDDRAFGLKPHQVDTFKISKDPLFVDKVRDVVGLHLDPPAKAVVLCVDESMVRRNPRNSSWLNLVERFFAEITVKLLRRGVHADQILDSLAAYCRRTNDSGH